MTTFAEINYLQNAIKKMNRSLWWISILYALLVITTAGTGLVFIPIYIMVIVISIKKKRKFRRQIMECKTVIESDPVLVAEYHADKNQHDFDEAVQNIRNHIRDCYHKIELCERNGQYQMAAKYRGDISTLESKLRQFGC